MQVDFYQLGRGPLASVLTRIATRVLAGGGRLLIVTGDASQATAIDEALWSPSDGFLPHGRDGRDQPVLIASTADAANEARHVALIDGLWREEATGFDRAFHFFDAASIDAARKAWRGLKGRADVEPRFWRQDDDGRWAQVT